MDIETDRKTITIEIREHANVVIQNLDVPSFGYINETIAINYDVFNQGGEDMCFCEVKTSDGVVLDRKELTLTPNSTTNIEHLISFDSVGNIDVIVKIGYIE